MVVFELLILFPSHFDTLEWSSIYKHGKRSPTWLSAYILCLLKHALGQFVIGHIDFCRSFRGLKRKVNLVHWRIVSIYTIQVPIFQSSTIQICLGIDHCILCKKKFLLLSFGWSSSSRIESQYMYSVSFSFKFFLSAARWCIWKKIHCKWIFSVYEYWSSL